MDNRVNTVAALANAAAYKEDAQKRNYIDGAPHIKHAALRKLYGKLVVDVFDIGRRISSCPKMLDLGAGEGSATLPFLELGAEVTAVDISESQLAELKKKCNKYGDRLKVYCDDIFKMLESSDNTYDIIVVNSFLHHIPQYLDLIKLIITRLNPRGVFFSFQDPLRFDTVGKAQMLFCDIAYLSWRLFKGDVFAGLMRRFRRARGIYLEDSMHDNVEYHSTRNGNDQVAMKKLFEENDFDCQIIKYFSTQNGFFQPVGTHLGVKNVFASIARKK